MISVIRYTASLQNFFWSLLNTPLDKFICYGCEDIISKKRGLFPWGLSDPTLLPKIRQSDIKYVVITPGPYARAILPDINNVDLRVLLLGVIQKETLGVIKDNFASWWPYTGSPPGQFVWRDIHFIQPVMVFIDITQLQGLGYSVRQIYNQIQNMRIPKIARQLGLDKAPMLGEKIGDIKGSQQSIEIRAFDIPADLVEASKRVTLLQ